MIGFIAAHGDDPGPTQRPLLAGAISGVISTVPAIATLILFGALRVEAQILGVTRLETVAAGCVLMALAGAAYGRLFGRAANDPRGGWLYGTMKAGLERMSQGVAMELQDDKIAVNVLSPQGRIRTPGNRFTENDPASWERLKRLYFRKKPGELKRLWQAERKGPKGG